MTATAERASRARPKRPVRRYTVTDVVTVEPHRVLLAALTVRGRPVNFHLRRDADVDGMVRMVRAGRRVVVETALPVKGGSS